MSRLNNKVILIGHLGDTIKMHHFEGGGSVGNVSLATNEKYKKQNGEVVQNTEWHNLVFRNKGAELVEKYTQKGSKIMVEGRLKYRKWQDESGKDRYSTEIHVNDMLFLDKKGETNSSASSPEPQGDNFKPEDDDGLPF